MRVDKFLKVSRIVKRRTVANSAASGGRISVNGKVVKPAAQLKLGDIVEVEFGSGTLKARVISLNEKTRDASSLYEVISE